MTTARRAQADGQTERQNLELEDALSRIAVMIGGYILEKFSVYEDVPIRRRKVSNPLTERMKELVYSESDGILAEFVKNFARERREVVVHAQDNLKHAQERQKEYYDRKHRQVVFKEGDLILFDTKNLPRKTVNKNTELETAKLADKKIGPFVIERMINANVMMLILPDTTKWLNPSFNKAVSIIPDNEAGEELYSEKLLMRRTRQRKREWLAKWHGSPEHEGA
ncbi:Retrotransposon protein [Phytophthora palmivora]|uniref:Retrotransposon protein n=1 Tax=Phytophthora palmivora TaxID=4796 RepID=A0A2P4XWG5_9STRA|nr:Retrotransposon protein [Phytophthora palmivora]